MRFKYLKAALFVVSVVLIILLTGTVSKMTASAEEKEFLIENGILKQYLGTDKEVIIPEGVQTIGTYAFADSSIERIIIPDGVYMIDTGAFQNCSKLTEIVIPDGVNYIFDIAFKNCISLEMIDLPESIRYIGGGCFSNCINLETIFFPTQDFSVGSKAFENTLWMMNYEGDYVVINQTLIQYRGKETDITIPDNITVIGDWAFSYCSFITNLNIPKSVKEIGSCAFFGCEGLTKIALPDSVANISYDAFNSCTKLADITVPKDTIMYSNPFNNTKWMKDYKGDFIVLNGNLLAYRGMVELIVIPDNVTIICSGAFTNSKAYEVIIPKNVEKIYSTSFNNCRDLDKVFITGRNVSIDTQAFYNCSSNLKLYGASGGSVEEYAKGNNIQFISYGLNKEKATIYLNGTNNVSLKVNGITGDVIWESEDVTIAKVSKSGIVTAVKAGTTKINATVNGITLTCQITVKKPYISKKTVTIITGNTSRVNIVGISKDLKWSSSNKSVAAVSSKGVITAINAGTAVITTKYNGKTYTCTVTVK